MVINKHVISIPASEEIVMCQVGYNELSSVQNDRRADVLVPRFSTLLVKYTHLQPEKPRQQYKDLHHP